MTFFILERDRTHVTHPYGPGRVFSVVYDESINREIKTKISHSNPLDWNSDDPIPGHPHPRRRYPLVDRRPEITLDLL